MYKFNNKLKRIDWFYKKYASTSISLEDFVLKVNESYYKYSAGLYAYRYTKDIEKCYSKMFSIINTEMNSENKHIVDIGGGTGFEYKIFKEHGVKYSEYDFIEPSYHMINEFKSYLDLNEDKKVSLHNCHLSERVPELMLMNNKVLIMNSALHHIIFIEDFLNNIKSSMNSKDLFILGHEPNNNNKYNAVMRLIQIITRAIFTSALLKRIPVIKNLFKNEAINTKRWKNINQDLISANISSREIPPIAIRRIIDYGVGHKNDIQKFLIPKDSNEGFIGVSDVSFFLGDDYKLKFYSTYRHFGDSNGNFVIEFLNKAALIFTKHFGTNYVAVWEKK